MYQNGSSSNQQVLVKQLTNIKMEGRLTTLAAWLKRINLYSNPTLSRDSGWGGDLDLSLSIKLYFPDFLKKRRENASLFVDLFKDHPDFLIQKEIGKSSWFGFSLIIKPGSTKKRKDVIEILEKNKIEYRPIVTGNFVRNDVLKYFDYTIHDKLKNADHLHDNGFFVGNNHDDLSKNIKFLKKILS